MHGKKVKLLEKNGFRNFSKPPYLIFIREFTLRNHIYIEPLISSFIHLTIIFYTINKSKKNNTFTRIMLVTVVFLLLLTLTAKKIWLLLKLLHIPGPIIPRGIQGDLPAFVGSPRQTGPTMAKIYGPVYR